MTNTPVAPILVDDDMVTRDLVVPLRAAMWLKAVLEAHEGLAHVFGESAGRLTLACARDREAELDAWLADLPQILREFELQMTKPNTH